MSRISDRFSHQGGKKYRQNHRVYLAVFAVLVIKVILMGLFSSDYQDRMFLPFVEKFLSGNNPYEYYYQNGLMSSFPYFPLMLFIEAVGGALIRCLSIANIFFRNLIFKLPLLVFDCVGFIFLRKLGMRAKYALAFYFCSPIILFGTYMHGQLDIIPTAFLLIAIYYLLELKKTLALYSIFLGCALATKLHILAAVPILFVYIWKKRNLITAMEYHVLALLVVVMFTVSFWGDGFINTVLFNKEQSLLMTTSFNYGVTQVLIPIFVLLIIYFSVVDLNYINKNMLLSMLGLLFAVFLICLPPMPAWFTWIVPFIALYFGYVEEDKHKVMILYGIFNVLYLLYFIFLHQTEYVDLYLLGRSLQGFKVDSASIKYTVFTAMIASLCIIVFKVYKFGLATNSLYQRRGKAFTIGIAGDSGAGKSKMLEKIERLFGAGDDVLFIEGDGDHRWVRCDEHWEQHTALDPQANYLYRQAEDLKKLKTGISVDRVDYDHDKGLFTEKKRVTPKKFIVLCGLHSLYLPKLRDVLDLKIYMDTDDELRKFWKIQRDTNERGYTQERIISQIEQRYPDARKYIYPQQKYADIVVHYFDKTLENCFVENHDVILSVKFEITIDLDIEPLLRSLEDYGLHSEWKISDSLTRQEVIFDGKELLDNNKLDFAKLVEENIPQYEDFLTKEPMWGNEVEGVIQLMLLFVITERMKAGERP